MRRGLEGGAKRDPVHDSSAVAADVSGWPGVGRTATTEAASGRRGPTLDGQPTSDVPAGQTPGGGWLGAGTAGASGLRGGVSTCTAPATCHNNVAAMLGTFSRIQLRLQPVEFESPRYEPSVLDDGGQRSINETGRQ